MVTRIPIFLFDNMRIFAFFSSCPAGYAVGHMENHCSGGRSGKRQRDTDIDTDTDKE